MRRWIVVFAIVACVTVPIGAVALSIRASDLRNIAERNCRAINTLVRKRNESAAKGRAIAAQLFREQALDQATPQWSLGEIRRTNLLLDSLFYTLEPIDC